MLVFAFMLSMTNAAGVEAKKKKKVIKEYYFRYKGTNYKMHGAASKLLKAAGKYESVTKNKIQGSNGYQRIYIYKNFVIATYTKKKQGRQYIEGIKLLTNKVRTKEGVRVGHRARYVKKKYGKQKPVLGMYKYYKNRTKLQFEMMNGRVLSIQYIALK